ncbi:hypothetical protein [Legionella maioricensis]|uniref:Uncharacterized protein n=1 Tax=Legionella maioricensis TaxID=2896528 RepID=A0A9X2IAX1_9GAMM|nr:hypothetical protein [Legionella maioricensis]MCL9682897.1 hypothetical protein [Legionella maioricensis]MCL9686475.1 hypothetical protein [Legionella maioricensis]
MGCLAEVWESEFDIRFNCNKSAQKIILEFLLTYSKYDLKELSELLEVTPFCLNQVLNDKEYLSETVSSKMMDWLYIFIGN